VLGAPLLLVLGHDSCEQNKLKVVGGIYRLATGKVDVLG